MNRFTVSADIPASPQSVYDAWLDGERILQTWRTIQFEDSDRDSSIVVTFEVSSTGTLVTLRHWNIPPDQAEGYESGWPNFYFAPMQDYFSDFNEE